MVKIHTFHIPVMGTGFSIDSPIKVAPYGISSVISLGDDELIEEMREFYCSVIKEEYVPIPLEEEDFRAKRITAYLNLVERIVQRRFAEVKNSNFEPGSEITKYFELLPDDSDLKNLYKAMLCESDTLRRSQLQERLRQQMRCGEIDVNIMTKLDRMRYDKNGNPLSGEYSDALCGLRGFAKSTLQSSVVFSAGFNRRLYSYIEQFEDFFHDAFGLMKKKITLKVSDYRSSLIQGAFLAKKGLWVSEYRIESGLNCGGHAFATDGELMGPILEEFKTKKQELTDYLFALYHQALKLRNKPEVPKPPEVCITAQGGIGTVTENKFLLNYYHLDRTGWGTPFLLVPEVTNVDEETIQKLAQADEEEVHLSEISPLGVPFYTLRHSVSELEKNRLIQKGRPGSPCPKGFLVSNTEFTKEPICTASRLYQKLKIDQLQEQKLETSAYQRRYEEIVRKACLCSDLSAGAVLTHKIPTKNPNHFSAVCPGPNIAYFSKIVTLAEMVGHIYGRINLLNKTPRPHMFIKELKLYVDYFVKEVKKVAPSPTEKNLQRFKQFKDNLLAGIEYYRTLFPKMVEEANECREKALAELQNLKKTLEDFWASHSLAFVPASSSIAT